MNSHLVFSTALAFFISIAQWSQVQCLPNGAPLEACVSLDPSPGHNADALNSPAPFQFDLTALEDGSGLPFYIPGMEYNCK
jgi:hypothetical protein